MYILGIDDAGRGPIIGPMFLAGVLVKKEDETELKKMGAVDSKLLSHPQRIKISKEIEKKAISVVVVESTPEEIDHAVNGGINLNTLEAKKAAEIINKVNDQKKKIQVILDCPSVNRDAWKKKLLTFIKHKANLDIICEHKADFNYAVVGAASIIAKVAREDAVTKLRKEFGEIGSGYPSDPITINFIRSKGKELGETGIVRKSWQTWKNLFPSSHAKKQKSLNDF